MVEVLRLDLGQDGMDRLVVEEESREQLSRRRAESTAFSASRS
jgi:hypothetical protein